MHNIHRIRTHTVRMPFFSRIPVRFDGLTVVGSAVAEVVYTRSTPVERAAYRRDFQSYARPRVALDRLRRVSSPPVVALHYVVVEATVENVWFQKKNINKIDNSHNFDRLRLPAGIFTSGPESMTDANIIGPRHPSRVVPGSAL